MKRFSNYKNYIIATSVLASVGKPFEASFFILHKVAGDEEEVIHTERLARTFAYSGDAFAAASQAAQVYIDNRQRI